MDVSELNSLDRIEATKALAPCCGSRVWVDRMLAAGPFPDITAILMNAEEIWWDLGADDWEEAFAAHRETQQPGTPPGYEEKFGYPYLVFAADRSAEELETLLRQRLDHDPLSELSVTAAEQARITNLALRRLLGSV